MSKDSSIAAESAGSAALRMARAEQRVEKP